MMQSFEWKAISKFGNPETPYEDYLVIIFEKVVGEPGHYYIDTATYNPGYGNIGKDWSAVAAYDSLELFRVVTHWADIPPLPKDLPLL